MSDKIIEVAAGVIIEHSKVLIVRRSPNQKLAGFWEFAGGKREPEETIEACLIRELKEELALHVEPREIIFTHDHRTEDGVIRLVSLGAKIVNGDPTLTVHDQLAWVRPIDLLAYKLLMLPLFLVEVPMWWLVVAVISIWKKSWWIEIVGAQLIVALLWWILPSVSRVLAEPVMIWDQLFVLREHERLAHYILSTTTFMLLSISSLVTVGLKSWRGIYN